MTGRDCPWCGRQPRYGRVFVSSYHSRPAKRRAVRAQKAGRLIIEREAKTVWRSRGRNFERCLHPCHEACSAAQETVYPPVKGEDGTWVNPITGRRAWWSGRPPVKEPTARRAHEGAARSRRSKARR